MTLIPCLKPHPIAVKQKIKSYIHSDPQVYVELKAGVRIMQFTA